MASMSRQYQMLRGRIIGGNEHRLLIGMAQQAGEGHVAGNLAGSAFAGILQVVGHEAAIDEDDAAVGKAKRRDDMKSWPVFVIQRVEVDLAVVQQLALAP